MPELDNTERAVLLTALYTLTGFRFGITADGLCCVGGDEVMFSPEIKMLADKMGFRFEKKILEDGKLRFKVLSDASDYKVEDVTALALQKSEEIGDDVDGYWQKTHATRALEGTEKDPEALTRMMAALNILAPKFEWHATEGKAPIRSKSTEVNASEVAPITKLLSPLKSNPSLEENKVTFRINSFTRAELMFMEQKASKQLDTVVTALNALTADSGEGIVWQHDKNGEIYCKGSTFELEALHFLTEDATLRIRLSNRGEQGHLRITVNEGYDAAAIVARAAEKTKSACGACGTCGNCAKITTGAPTVVEGVVPVGVRVASNAPDQSNAVGG